MAEKKHILQIVFHALILLGLLFQLQEVSINFFKYETVSVISIIMPEEDKLQKYFNLCIENKNIIDYKKFNEYVSNEKIDLNGRPEGYFLFNLTLNQRFNFTSKFKHILFRGFDISFIYGIYMCYQKKQTDNQIIFAFNNENISSMYSFFSLEYPNINFERRQNVVFKSNGNSVFTFSSSSHHIIRLASPYSDDCRRYEHGRYYYKASCENIKYIETRNEVYPRMTVTDADDKYLNYSISRTFKDVNYDACNRDAKLKDDCNSHAIFTYYEPRDMASDTRYTFGLFSDNSNIASSNVESIPKIGNIDFVTYIFGALGTWIGFSFIQLDPLNVTMKWRNKNENYNFLKRSEFKSHVTLFRIETMKNSYKINRIENILKGRNRI